ncbi:MAG: hypothetical protein M3198_10435 [Actinomycetota bacterium]|nr:hypothetical protein [Actinomycetota bacterium]
MVTLVVGGPDELGQMHACSSEVLIDLADYWGRVRAINGGRYAVEGRLRAANVEEAGRQMLHESRAVVGGEGVLQLLLIG